MMELPEGKCELYNKLHGHIDKSSDLLIKCLNNYVLVLVCAPVVISVWREFVSVNAVEIRKGY